MFEIVSYQFIILILISIFEVYLFIISDFNFNFNLILIGNHFNFEMQNIINNIFFSILFRQQNLSPFNVQVKYYD